jgi:molybdate transport system substrate-binding protein
MITVRYFFLVTLALSPKCAISQQQPHKILVAAASDLKFGLDSIIAVFSNDNNSAVDVTYGSSGKLFEQISNGAPFDIFFSADISYPRQLKELGMTSSEVYNYGIGRIVLWSKKIDPRKDGMNSLLSPSIKKVAIANPAHAPYGKRAEEALIYYKMQEAVKGKLVYGENISQTAQFVTTGAADIGFVALSLALSPNMKKEGGSYYLIPQNSHNPLEQGAVITIRAKGNDLAKAFMDYMKSEKVTDILTYFGFTKL